MAEPVWQDPDQLISRAKLYSYAHNTGGISDDRRLLFISPDCDDFASGRLLELEADAMRSVFIIRFITDAGDYIVVDLHDQAEYITPRYWGQLPSGWEIHPVKVSPVR